MNIIKFISDFILKLISKVSIFSVLVICLIVLNTLTLVNKGVHDFLYNGLSSLLTSGLLANSPTSKNKKAVKKHNTAMKKSNEKVAKLSKENKQLASDLKQSRGKVKQLSKESDLLKAEKKMFITKKNKMKGIAGKIVNRSVKNTAVNMASVPAESVPWVGAGVVVAVTAMDIKDSCDSMKDMNEMMRMFELNEYKNETNDICGYKVNFKEEYSEMNENIGGFIHHLKEESDRKFEKFNDAVGGTSVIAVENVKRSVDSFYDKLGETIYFMLND